MAAQLAVTRGHHDAARSRPTGILNAGTSWFDRGMRAATVWLGLAACGHHAGAPPPATDAPTLDAAAVAPDAATACAYEGAPGQCLDVTACAAIADHSAFPGLCPGAATIQCCVQTPSVADNPATPTGYQPMMDSEVTPAMTTWAVAILHDPVTYPMFATATMTFGTLMVLARAEWHPPDVQNAAVHRGVSLYEPI